MNEYFILKQYKWKNEFDTVNKYNNKELMKPIVGVDVDEVLCPFVEQLCKFHRAYKESDIEVNDFFCYVFREIDKYDVSNEKESRQLLHTFFESNYFDEMPVISNSPQILFELKKDFNFSVVTSRRNTWKIKTIKWINQYFDGIFDEILFGNHFSEKGKSLSKPEMCRQINASIMIDDNIDYCLQCANHMDIVILFGNYPWNSNISNYKKLPPNIYRVSDWYGVNKLLQTHSSIK